MNVVNKRISYGSISYETIKTFVIAVAIMMVLLPVYFLAKSFGLAWTPDALAGMVSFAVGLVILGYLAEN